MLTRYPGRGGGVTLGIFGWGCAAGTFEPLAFTELVQLNFLTLDIYIYTSQNKLPKSPFPQYTRVAVFQKLLTEVTSTA